MPSTPSSRNGKPSNPPIPSPSIPKPQAIPFTTLTLADTIHAIPHNAPFTHQTSPPSWLVPSTPVFSGLATNKQIRGAGIGSQLSPALCNVAITRTLAPAPQQPPPPLRPTLHLLPLCGQSLHRPQRTFPLPPSHPNAHPPQLFRRSSRA